jgi:phenylpropionate dioxygenase-like ring-hydroxylating dioxygenase large terminal subunit
MTDVTTAPAEANPLDVSMRAGLPRRPDFIDDAGARPRIRRESTPRFPFPIPNGWFIVATSAELAPLEVKPIYYFGRDLVLYRTASGEARVVSAYCAHLGAHLASGGVVKDDAIACPFHGWNYDGETGKCVAIPYGSGKIPSQAKIRSFPTMEGKPPFYDVPVVPEFDDPEYGIPYTVDFVLNTVCQEMAENNHDPAHFQFVHGTDSIPEEDVFIDGTYKRVIGMNGGFVRETFGLGLGVLRVTNYVTFLSSTTPVDEEHVNVRWTFLSPLSRGPEASQEAAVSFTSGLSQDIPLWENKRYVERPILIKDERTILDHREWCQQFYSDPALAID